MKKPWGDQLLVWQEWIQKRNAKDQEVAFIARGYDEAMDPRCGGDHGIFDQMVCLAAHKSSPFAKTLRIHRQNLNGIRELIHPNLNFLGFPCILRSRSFNARLQFAQSDSGQKELFVALLIKPGDNAAVRLGLPQFGNHVCVQQKPLHVRSTG